MGLRVGAASGDLTVFEPGLPMLGWGLHTNTAEGVHTPLRVRAFVFADPTGKRLAYVSCELSMISDSLRLGVLEHLAIHAPHLGIGGEQLMMAATHTHSGPGGYPHHMFFNLPNPGCVPRVLRELITRIANTIVAAAERLEPATLRFATADTPPNAPVAYNRNTEAYNRNDDVQRVPWSERHKATDPTMYLLRIDRDDGTPIGLINWFPLHCTSVHADQHLLHPDNKGIAALLAEKELGHDAVAAFAQGAAGDVSPNHVYHRKRKLMVGGGVDDYESAAMAGRAQFATAGRAHSAADNADALPPTLDAVTLHIDLRGFEVAPRFARGQTGRRTGAARMGLGFIEGTLEGPGPLLPASGLTRALVAGARLRQRLHPTELSNAHGPKVPFLGVGEGALTSAFGYFRADKPVIPGGIDPVVRAMHRFHEIGAVTKREWIPNILALQIFVLGDIAIVGLPIEPTTVAGRRIRAQVQAALAPRGVRNVVVAGYTNGYASYLTTYEEYQAQRYEGASTLYGQWTLAAFQTKLEEACARLLVPTNARNMDPGPAITPFPPTDVFAQVWEGVAGAL